MVVAGPLANPTRAFYESSGMAALYIQLSDGNALFFNGATQVFSMLLASLSSTNDYFVAESFMDGNHTVIVLYGIQAAGTLASGVFFDSNLWDNLELPLHLTAGIVHWQGTTPNVPLPTDSYTPVYQN
jgi:hypothetical protein